MARDKQKKPSGCLKWVIGLAAVAAVTYIFLDEVLAVIQIGQALWARVNGVPPAGPLPLLPLEALFSTLLISILFFFVLLLVLSQAILPIGSLGERWQVFSRVLRRMFNSQGAAVFVQAGKTRSSLAEMKDRRPGMIFVDASSAVVAAQQGVAQKGVSPVRVLGAGVHYTRDNEVVSGLVDLRVQRRTAERVKFQTADGIDVQCDVTVDFSLSEHPEILVVAVCGDAIKDVRVLQVDVHSKKILATMDDLDPADKLEIFNQAREAAITGAPSSRLEARERRLLRPPLPIDRDRVLSAVYAQGQMVKEGDKDLWTDQPVQYAITFLRNLIVGQFFEDLFQRTADGQGFVLGQDLRPNFGRWVKTDGVVAYQIVQRRDGRTPQVGEVIHHASYWVSPVNNLASFKILRARGIKVIAATFGDLQPVSEAVQLRRQERWEARRRSEPAQPDKAPAAAIADIHTRSRQQAQRDLTSKLALALDDPTLSSQEQSREVMALLNNLAKEPYVRSFIPTLSLNRLDELYRFLRKYGSAGDGSAGDGAAGAGGSAGPSSSGSMGGDGSGSAMPYTAPGGDG